MPSVSLKEKLEKRTYRILDDAIELALLGDRFVRSHDIAERVYESEPDLIADVTRGWVLERLTWMIARRRRARGEELRGGQMILPDPIFQNLPKRIFLRDGTRPKLIRAVLSTTEEHLRLLRERFRNHPRVVQFEAVVELHRKWAAVTRGITLEEAMRREAEEREA